MKKYLFAPGALEIFGRRDFLRTERRLARAERRSHNLRNRRDWHTDTWARYLLICCIVLAYSLLGGVLVGWLQWSLSWGAMR